MTDNKAEGVIQKAESHKKTVVPISTEKGQPRIVTSSRLIEDVKKSELSADNRLNTFASMMLDADVSFAVNYTRLFPTKALTKGSVVSTGTPASDVAAEFLNYNLFNMEYGTWLQACMDMTTAIQNGWSDLNIVVTERKYGEYKGQRCLKKLSPRSQTGTYSWLWNDNLSEWKGLIQKPPYSKVKTSRSNFLNLQDSLKLDSNYIRIPSEQLLHISYNGTNRNPQGDSPLLHCFDAWFEKKLLENFELSGVSKDLNGILKVIVPSKLIEEAADPEAFPDSAAELAEIQQDAADLHQGQTTHILLTSDTDEKGNRLYDIELAGISGAGGKSYVTSQIVDQKRKAIYNVFGAGFLLLGQDGGGSYALSSNQTSVHAHMVELAIMQFEDAINSQLLPRLLAANNIYLSHKDMPKFVAADPDQVSLDELGKFLQRTKSTGSLTMQMMVDAVAKSGLPVEGIEDIDFTTEDTSRAGDGMKTAGEGTAKKVGGGDKSSANTENGGVSKSLNEIYTEKGSCRIINRTTGECINAEELDDEGQYK